MTHVIQQLRIEVNETVSGRIDMFNSINTALQRVSAKRIGSKPYRISDFTPRNFEGSNDKGEFRNFMSNLHLWMQAWTDEGETMLVSVESTHKVDNCTLAIDCSDEEFGSIETSLYQVLRRTLANEPLRQKGFEP